MAFIDVLTETRMCLSDHGRDRLAPLFDGDRLSRLARHLEKLAKDCDSANDLQTQPGGEVGPILDDQLAPFLDACRLAITSEGETAVATAKELATLLESMQASTLLFLLGRRVTKDSITDERAYPPPLRQLLDSASKPCGNEDGVSVAARSLATHSRGETDNARFDVSGTVEHQNDLACSRIVALHESGGTWNIFSHYQHGLVYEVRDQSGHGACWTHDGIRFIGFVAPPETASQQPVASTSFLIASESVGDVLAVSESDLERANGAVAECDGEASFGPLPEIVDRAIIAERYAKGQRRFENLDLSGADLQNLDLRGILFRGCKLSKAKLFNTNLQGADLSDCDIQNTYLVKTELSDVIARRTNFHGCRMDGCHLKGLDLQSADLGECGLKGAVLDSCLMKATKLRGAELTDARIVRTRMYGINTEGSVWKNARIDACALNHGHLGNTDFSSSSFDRCRFESASLSSADCSNATFANCDFVEADMANANFSEAKMPFAIMERTVLTGVNLQRAELNGARLNRANLTRAKLNGANLSGADLTQADLSRADLRNANLSNAVLDRTDLSWADVVDTVVDDSTRFSAAKTTGVDFGTNWLLRQRVFDSAHELTIQHYRRKHRVAGFLWWALLGCGKRNYLLLFWGIAFVFLFAGLMAINPSSFDFGQSSPTFIDHLRNSLAVFVTLDLAVDKGTDTYGRSVMLAEMLMSYLMLGFMASLFSSIFPRSPD
jgi:uncharacterized protein YjbI with pentapeptide repeats